MLKLSIVICIITQFLSNCPSAYCNNDNDSSSLEKDMENEIDLDSENYIGFDKGIDENDPTEVVNFIDPHSLFYDRHSKKVIDEVDSLPIKENKKISILNKNNEGCDTLKVYYKRFILLLLSNANLKVEDDSVEGLLYIKGTYKQIETLKTLETGNYSIKEIDLILSEIISKTPDYNFFDKSNSSETIFSFLQFNLLNCYVEIIGITTTMIATVILLRIMSLYRALVIIFIVLFMVSFYMTWLHLVKEAEIKLTVAQVKYTKMPIACQPHKMGVWDTFKSYMFDNKECEQYIEAKIGNPKLGVTPAIVLSHMFATVALQPVALIGETISKFISNATAHLNWLSGPVQLILYICLPAFFMILVFALRGGSVDFGLGYLFKFSFSTHKRVSVTNTDKRQTIELIREVLAEIPRNVPLSITENTQSVPLPVTNSIQEDDRSTDNLSEDQSTKLISNESKKEQICASGDSVQNDLLFEQSKNTSKESVEAITTDTAKHIGSGDA